MKRIFLSLVTLALGAAPLAAAPPKHAPVKPETVLEATAETVTLPSTPDGILLVRACQTCPPKSYRVTSRTIYSLAGQSIGLKEMRAALLKNSRMNVDVSLSPKTFEVETVDATPQGGNK